MLTEKQEKYCQNRASGLNYTDSYKGAYDTSNMKDETINNEAYKLENHHEIATRIKSLKEQAVNKYIMKTIEKKEWLTDKVTDSNLKMKDRLSALDMLNKMDGEYIERLKLSNDEDKPFEVNINVVR